ncbi:MAG: UvrD-helicase domain-containing protein [Flammeovirgaceae bacterium]|nr:UvrD-helicase domain-containing protein [Flammeovirgaceae bacterium]
MRLALKRPEYFRFILAMTFTNKSTQEMKDRILRYLSDFAKGESQDLAEEIIREEAKDGVILKPAELRKRSEEVLTLLLHRYAEFSVSTIDAFFQRIIRSFTRETGLLGNFRLEVDNAFVMEEVIDILVSQLSANADLRGWLLEFSMEKLTDGKDWDVRKALLDFAQKIEKEDFKAIEESVLHVTEDKSFFRSFRKRLSDQRNTIEKTVFSKAEQLINEIGAQQLTSDDFSGKSTGIYSYIKKLSREVILPSNTVSEIVLHADKWPHKSSPRFQVVLSHAKNKWQPQLAELVSYIEQNLELYHSVSAVIRNMYSFGLISDILRTQRKYLSDENLMLLSDASQFLNKLMNEQDTSFIYEKVGSFYRHFLLDEFQDTSGLQWKNLLPLIQNGLAQNYSSLIVGDVKQSIYRWRGGDLSILQSQLQKDIHPSLTATHELDTNYRSDGAVVTFNNHFFQSAAEIIAAQSESVFAKEAYREAEQKVAVNPDRGFVRIQFLEEEDDEDSFLDRSLARLPRLIEELQEKGVPLKDIAFLVRTNREGQQIANRFMEYRASAEAIENCRYDVVSNESLMVDRASCVLVLLSALRLLEDANHQIARAHLAFEYQKLWPTQAFIDWNEIFTDSKTTAFHKWMPPTFMQQRERLAALPLFEMVENLIQIFNLGTVGEEVIYLQSFQDIIQEFSQREKNDLTSFLAWWELNREKKSIQVAGGVDAAQIITIHKAKGLQFKYVIIPFLDWELGAGFKEVLLWCKSEHPLLQEAGYMPIRYVSNLSKTVFKDDYLKETQRLNLDNLNLLYVAFTRAEAGLIAFAPDKRSSKEGKFSTVGQLAYEIVEQNAQWVPQEKKLEIGTIQPLKNTTDVPQQILSLKNYVVTPWRDRLQVRTSGMEFFTPNEKREKINYGIFLHAILSKVRTKEDVTPAMQRAMQQGVISESERSELEVLVQWVVNLPELQPCFDPQAQCKMEATLLTTQGFEKRIDRVAMIGTSAYVVDYKTGDPTNKDVAQVKEYMQLLMGMGWKSVKGYLVYVQEKNCVEVTL